MGYGERTSLLTSVTVAQISEFSFIFAAVGLSAGLIDQAILSVIAVVGLVTIGISAYMILYNHQLYAYRCRRVGVPVAIHVFDRSVLRGAEIVAPQFIIDSKQAADDKIEQLLADMGVIIS
jgi:Kef-type K+ transport system membrane component KefB